MGHREELVDPLDKDRKMDRRFFILHEIGTNEADFIEEAYGEKDSLESGSAIVFEMGDDDARSLDLLPTVLL